MTYNLILKSRQCFITPSTAIWTLPSVYILMYLQIVCFSECIIKHTTAICTFHSAYPTLRRKGSNIAVLK